MYVQRWHGWCHVKLLPSSRRKSCVHHTTMHHVTSCKATLIRKVYACSAVTCHLHFWQNDLDLLRATVVTRGWNGYRTKSQNRKLILEKKIVPPLLQGFEPANCSKQMSQRRKRRDRQTDRRTNRIAEERTARASSRISSSHQPHRVTSGRREPRVGWSKVRQSHKTVSTDHNFLRDRRAETETNEVLPLVPDRQWKERDRDRIIYVPWYNHPGWLGVKNQSLLACTEPIISLH